MHVMRIKWASYFATASFCVSFYSLYLSPVYTSYFPCAHSGCVCVCCVYDLARWVDSQVLCAPKNLMSTVTHIQLEMLHCIRARSGSHTQFHHMDNFSALDYRFLFLNYSFAFTGTQLHPNRLKLETIISTINFIKSHSQQQIQFATQTHTRTHSTIYISVHQRLCVEVLMSA